MAVPEVNLRIVANAEELSRMAAEQFVHLAGEAVRAKGSFTVALAGGSTPKALYTLLARESDGPLRARLPWDKIHFFWGDERHVPPEHPESNYRMASEALLSRAPVPAANVHRIPSEKADAARAAEAYEETLREFFVGQRRDSFSSPCSCTDEANAIGSCRAGLTGGQLPRFDLVLLGMGTDGHTASLFPDSEAIHEKGRLVVAPWVETLHRYRITLTPPVLNHAACVLFLVSGREKAETLREVLQGEDLPDRFPARLIRPTHGRLLWLVDQAAAHLLRLERSRV